MTGFRPVVSHIGIRCAFLVAGLLLFCNAGFSQAQNKQFTDSIFAYIKSLPDDTAKVRYINDIYDSDLWMYNLPEAYNQLKLAARLAKQLESDTLEYRSYRAMAGYCIRANAQDYALQNTKAALKIAEQMNDSVRIASCWAGMAMAFSGLGQNELAIQYYRMALPYASTIERVGRIHTFIGWAYDGSGKVDSGIVYCEMGRAERAQAGYAEGVLATDGSLLGMYLRTGEYNKARAIISEVVYIHDTLGHVGARESTGLWLGTIHEKENNLDSAEWYYRRAATYAEQTSNIDLKKASYQKLAELLERTGRKAEAYLYYREFVRINDSIKDWESKNNLARAREIYDVESKNQEIERLLQESTLAQLDIEKKERQRLWLGAITGITSLLVVIALLAYRQKQKSAKLLEAQKLIIEEKNQDITDSIVYAKRIQQAILPSMTQITNALPESFVFFRPKDIVSGDFFWFNETPWSYYLAAVDCTGHGVPGAMMSMIGHNFLGQIVNEQDIEQPAQILNELHRKVLFALNKDYTSHDMKDGMDVALIRIDKKSGKIFFSGAVRPLYIVVDGELTIVKGDIYSIGGIKEVNAASFSQHEIEAPEGSCLYIFSDGFADQFGGPEGKKFKYRQLKEMIVKNSDRPMQEQLAVIERTFNQWKGPHEQVDDVCIIGLRVSGLCKL